MYFGRPPWFPRLCYYVMGCEQTLYCLAPESSAYLELAGFDPWLCERFQIRLPSFRWHQIIWERAAEDLQQVQLFVDLFLEYRAEREQGQLQSPSHPST